jgi:hypothetical protein
MKYQEEINAVVSQLNKDLKTGVLLQLVFKNPTLFKETVYTAGPLGFKRAAEVFDEEASDNQSSTRPSRSVEDALEIMNLFKSPEQKITTDSIDKLQFRVVLTADKLLDVFNKEIYENFEIHAYANPQEALEKFHQGIQSIMKKIERDVENFSTIHEVYKEMQKELENFSLYVEPFDPTTFSVHSIQQSLVQYDSLAKKFRVLRRIFGFEVAKYPDEASSNSSLHHEQYDQVEKHVRHVIQLVQDELKKAKSSKHYPGINAMISRMRLEQKEADFTQLLKELNAYKQKRFGTPPSLLRPDE